MSIQFMGVQLGLLPGQHHEHLAQQEPQQSADPFQPPPHIPITYEEHPSPDPSHPVSPSDVSSFSLSLPSDLLPAYQQQPAATAAAAAASSYVAEGPLSHAQADEEADDEDLDTAGPHRTLSELYADAWYRKSVLRIKKASKAYKGSSDTSSESSHGNRRKRAFLKWPLRRQGSTG